MLGPGRQGSKGSSPRGPHVIAYELGVRNSVPAHLDLPIASDGAEIARRRPRRGFVDGAAETIVEHQAGPRRAGARSGGVRAGTTGRRTAGAGTTRAGTTRAGTAGAGIVGAGTVRRGTTGGVRRHAAGRYLHGDAEGAVGVGVLTGGQRPHAHLVGHAVLQALDGVTHPADDGTGVVDASGGPPGHQIAIRSAGLRPGDLRAPVPGGDQDRLRRRQRRHVTARQAQRVGGDPVVEISPLVAAGRQVAPLVVAHIHPHQAVERLGAQQHPVAVLGLIQPHRAHVLPTVGAVVEDVVVHRRRGAPVRHVHLQAALAARRNTGEVPAGPGATLDDLAAAVGRALHVGVGEVVVAVAVAVRAHIPRRTLPSRHIVHEAQHRRIAGPGGAVSPVAVLLRTHRQRQRRRHQRDQDPPQCGPTGHLQTPITSPPTPQSV